MNEQITHMAGQVTAGKMTRREFMGKAAALGVSAAVASTMFADAARAAGPKKGGDLKLGLQGGESTNSLDPATYASSVPYMNGRHFGDGLVEVAADGTIEPRLAESVEGSADAKVWTFKLRQGVEFHNGKTMTSEDVLKTMQRHSNEDSKSGALGIMKGIESMKADGDNFQVTLSEPNADLPYLMADYHLIIQPDGGMDNPGAGIGTGPYKVEVDEPGVRHLFTKFANYWNDDGHFDSVENIVINDATARTAALQSGQVQLINRVEPKVADLLGRAPNLTVHSTPGRGHYVFVMHVDTAPFDNHDLRMALKYAINREEMVDKILRGYGSVGNDMPINAAYPLFDETIPQREFDLEKAAEHYKKSGHDGSPIVLRTSDVAFPGAVDAAALFQQTAAQAGITLDIKREPGDGYWNEIWNVQPFCASYWSGRPVQDQMYATTYLSSSDWNDTRFKVPAFDDLLFAARAELDPAKRKELYSQMGMMIRDDGGLICPMFNDSVEGMSNLLDGWESNPGLELMNGQVSRQLWFV
ncbi:twin-arginine translocation signal domain-containing protein [Ruegeria sp. HKCCD6228]|uniref:ABC transporter substrate-binding protein n=1 Tax=unclassified Ruegeria TaxID=2625375 RepID=UPI00148991ED|nr:MULTISPECIES: ABC transporter substrate-binding protein [unclassified Ruegeria]NOD98267.1 twin-arginine translocation signal domain-containing protein [Ruegeria sp. HKCCD6228]NOE25166.1 twin-arginine translocation signal domain-containing protein [Ruegeria sp. HKCCD6157]